MMDDQSLIEAMEEFENDRILAETADALERQLVYQEQIGGNPLSGNLVVLSWMSIPTWTGAVSVWG